MPLGCAKHVVGNDWEEMMKTGSSDVQFEEWSRQLLSSYSVLFTTLLRYQQYQDATAEEEGEFDEEEGEYDG